MSGLIETVYAAQVSAARIEIRSPPRELPRPPCAPAAHRPRHCVVHFDHDRRSQPAQRAIERGDLAPVGHLRRRRFGVQRADRCLYLIGSRIVKGERLVQNRNPLVDFGLIPACPILVIQQHEFARCIEARLATRIVQQHQRQQTECFGALRQQVDQHPAQADCLAAQIAARQCIASGGAITLVEDQVNDRQQRLQPFRQ